MRTATVTRMFALFVLAGMLASGCGGDGGGTPAAPTPTVTAVSVASANSLVFIGDTEQMTATATLTNGTPQAATGVWGSDNTNVATVGSTSGLATGAGSGEATIFIDTNGRRGTKKLRILPNYAGSWSGSYAITSCQQSGGWATVNFCSNFRDNQVFPQNFVLAQVQDNVSGRFFLGTLQFEDTSSSVSLSGELALTSTYQSEDVTLAATWRVNSTQPGRMTGTVTDVWRQSDVAGQMTVKGRIRDSNLTLSGFLPRFRPVVSLEDALSAVAGR